MREKKKKNIQNKIFLFLFFSFFFYFLFVFSNFKSNKSELVRSQISLEISPFLL